MRILMAQYIAISWTDVQLGCKSHGKPYVASPSTDLCFNQSDSGNLAVFAFVAGCELGVDVEAVHPLTDIENLAARFFSSEEIVDLLSIPPEYRQTAFFAAWTRKEAYLKAVGCGLHYPLDSFRVTLLPGEEARLVHIEGNRRTTDSWRMRAFIPAEGYLGALAYSGRSRNVRLFPAMEASDLLTGKTVRIPSGSLVY
jgi:4'-phosphopantetheinyl transferase